MHVTQGTLDNADLGPAPPGDHQGPGRRDVLVVATTGGPDPAAAAGLPANVRLERFIPHDLLLPHVDAMVTNGGYGGVQQALAHGVPLVVAGDSEDKPEVAARVRWSGAGIDLHTGRPSVAMVARAVRRVLTRPSYRERARELQAEIAATDPLAAISAVLGELSCRLRRTDHTREPHLRWAPVAGPRTAGRRGRADDRPSGGTVALLPARGTAGRARRSPRRRCRLLLAHRVHAAAGERDHRASTCRRRVRPSGGRCDGGLGAAESSGRFTYTKTVVGDDTAFLEFETTMEGKYVNGVDIIRCNDAGRIVEFRVMIRPLQAVDLVHRRMAAMLESMNPDA